MGESTSKQNMYFISTLRFAYRMLTLTVFFGLFQPVYNVPKNLSLPNPSLCATRKINYRLQNVGYYVTWLEKDTRNLFLNWLDARNYCRDRCMDLISMETKQEIDFVKQSMEKNKIEYCWTSGRLCNFGGCDRKDLQPKEINGWFWSASDAKMKPTNERSQLNDWSFTGAIKKPQPDNREEKSGGYTEACMAVLNNYYNDGIKWHDVACHHIKSFVCEDSPKLLNYARSINKDKKIKF